MTTPGNPTADAYALGFQAGEKQERERCAKIADKYERSSGSVNGREVALAIATAIRRACG